MKQIIKQKVLISLILTLILFVSITCNVSSLTEEGKYLMTGEVKWVYADDLDNDGEVEILVHVIRATRFEEYSMIYILDKNGEIKGDIDAKAEIFDIHVMNFDEDREKEIIAATGGLVRGDINKPYGSIQIFDKNGNLKQDPFERVTRFRSVYAADIDNDSKNEIVAASGHGIAISNQMYCYCDVYLLNRRLEQQWTFKEQEHEDRFFFEEYLDIYVEDLDNVIDSNNKTHKEIITSTNLPRIYVLNSNNGTLRWNYSLDGIDSVYATDIDNPEELREATLYPCNITELNETEKLKEGKAICYACDITSCNETCNVSCREVIASSDAGTIYVFNSNGELRWNYTTGIEIMGSFVSDLDGEGNKEIIVGSDEVYVFDNKGELLWKYKTRKNVFSIHVADLNDDNIKEIIAGTGDGLYILGADGELYENYDAELPVKSVHVEDIDNDNIKEIIAGIGWYLHVFKTNKINLYAYSAEGHYKMAQNYYEKENYDTALVYATKAYNNYVFTGDADRISKSNELILNIEKKIYIKSKENEAGEYLETAKFYYYNYYNVSNQTNITNCAEINESLVNVSPAVCAKEYAKKARVIYLELGFEDMVNLTDPMIPEIERGGINVTINETQKPPQNETITKTDKGLIEQITSKELKFFGVPVLYIILIIVLIFVIFVLPIFIPEPKVMEPLNLVIIGATWGEQAKAHLLVSFLLGARDANKGRVLEICRIEKGFTQDQLDNITKNLKKLIIKEDEKEVKVKPIIVVEVVYEGIKKSSHYTSGYELKFPHLVRVREDMDMEDADTIDRVKQLMEEPPKPK